MTGDPLAGEKDVCSCDVMTLLFAVNFSLSNCSVKDCTDGN